MFPREEHLDAFGREEFQGDEQLEDIGAEEFFQGFEREGWQRVERAVAGEETVGDQGVEVFVAAMVAAEAGEAADEVAAVEEFVHDLRDDRAQGAEAGLVVVRLEFDEGGEVAVGALPERRLARVAGAVGLHGEKLPLGRGSLHLAGMFCGLVARPAMR